MAEDGAPHLPMLMSASLLMQPRSKGKAHAIRIVSTCYRVVTIIIYPSLALGTVQATKYQSSVDQSLSPIHLDEVEQSSTSWLDIRHVTQLMNSLTPDDKAAFTAIDFPQTLANRSCRKLILTVHWIVTPIYLL